MLKAGKKHKLIQVKDNLGDFNKLPTPVFTNHVLRFFGHKDRARFAAVSSRTQQLIDTSLELTKNKIYYAVGEHLLVTCLQPSAGGQQITKLLDNISDEKIVAALYHRSNGSCQSEKTLNNTFASINYEYPTESDANSIKLFITANEALKYAYHHRSFNRYTEPQGLVQSPVFKVQYLGNPALQASRIIKLNIKPDECSGRFQPHCIEAQYFYADLAQIIPLAVELSVFYLNKNKIYFVPDCTKLFYSNLEVQEQKEQKKSQKKTACCVLM